MGGAAIPAMLPQERTGPDPNQKHVVLTVHRLLRRESSCGILLA
jgi:hypothetical protein